MTKKATQKVSKKSALKKKDIEKVLGECNDDCYKLLMKDGTRRIVPKEDMPKELLK